MKKKYIYALSFFLPLLTLLVGMVIFGVAPFGDHSLLIIDGLHQYMPFFSILYDKLHAGETLFYSFRTGLGINFLSLFSYYLSSPFNLIILLFPRKDLNAVVSALIVLKLSLSGLFAGIYFTKRSRKPGFHIVAMAVAYALNGYMVGYCWNVMWLDAIMIFPIIMLGIEKLIEENDGKVYALSLFYALFCNYYIGFMICIFSVIWFLFYRFRSFGQFICRGISFAIHSLLAGGMAAVLLIPAYFGIKATASGDQMFLPSHSWLTNMWDIIVRQYNMGYPITHDNFDGNANLYFGIFTITFLVLYLFNRKISILEKLKKLLLVVFFYISFNEEILNFIWHGFHNQYGIPNRFSFLYGFVLLVMAFDVLEHIEEVRIWQAVLAFLAGAGVLAGAYFLGEKEVYVEVIVSSVLLLFVYSITLIFMKTNRKNFKYYYYFLLAVMAGEVLVSALLGFDTNGQISISKFFYATEDMEKATKDLEDGTFYRSELAKALMVDENAWYPMHGIGLFGSTAREETVDIMNSLGFSTGCNEYLFKGANPLTNLLLNVRYLYYHEGDNINTEFNYKDSYGCMQVYENPVQGLSIGYGINEAIDEWYYESDYPFRVLDDFCYEGYNMEGIFENIDIFDPITNGCSVTRTNDGEYRFDFESKEMDNLEFTINMDQASDNLLLFYDGTQVENVEVMVGDETRVSGDMDGQIMQIGSVEERDIVRVIMSLKGESNSGYVRLSAANFHQDLFEELADVMTSQAFKMEKFADNHIEGSVDFSVDKYLMFSIPYDEGWTIKVDGKNVETTQIGNAFLSAIIPEGEHKVVLDFTPSGFWLGAAVSGGSVFCFILISIGMHLWRKKHPMTGGDFDEDTEEDIQEEDNSLDPLPCDGTDSCQPECTSDGNGGCSGETISGSGQ